VSTGAWNKSLSLKNISNKKTLVFEAFLEVYSRLSSLITKGAWLEPIRVKKE
jgi:hypothetical protein